MQNDIDADNIVIIKLHKDIIFPFFGNRFCVKRFISCHDGKSYITLGIGIFLNDILPPYFFSVWVVAGQTCFSQSRSSLRVIKTVSVNSVWITTNGKPSYITLSHSFTAVGNWSQLIELMLPYTYMITYLNICWKTEDECMRCFISDIYTR